MARLPFDVVQASQAVGRPYLNQCRNKEIGVSKPTNLLLSSDVCRVPEARLVWLTAQQGMSMVDYL